MVLNDCGTGRDGNSHLQNGTQTFGKDFHIKSEKALKKKRKKVLDRQEQIQAQLLGNHLYSSMLCLLTASRGMALLGKAPNSALAAKTEWLLFKGPTTKHLHGVY